MIVVAVVGVRIVVRDVGVEYFLQYCLFIADCLHSWHRQHEETSTAFGSLTNDKRSNACVVPHDVIFASGVQTPLLPVKKLEKPSNRGRCPLLLRPQLLHQKKLARYALPFIPLGLEKALKVPARVSEEKEVNGGEQKVAQYINLLGPASSAYRRHQSFSDQWGERTRGDKQMLVSGWESRRLPI